MNDAGSRTHCGNIFMYILSKYMSFNVCYRLHGLEHRFMIWYVLCCFCLQCMYGWSDKHRCNHQWQFGWWIWAKGRCCWWQSGILSFLDPGSTLYTDYHCTTMWHQKVATWRKYLHLLSEKVVLLQDNMHSHAKHVIVKIQKQFLLECLAYPPYNLNLVLIDFHLFRLVKHFRE